MNIIVDENIPKTTVAHLRTAGHVVMDLRGTDEQGSPDSLLWDKVPRFRSERLSIQPRGGAIMLELKQGAMRQFTC